MRPPRAAAWLAGWRLTREEREFALGDLEEEFADIAAVTGVRAARRWYWRQAVRVCAVRRSRYSSLPSHATPRKPLMQNLLHDVRFALRLVRRSPAFTTVVTLTLALGIGATTAIYSVVHAALLAPLPFKDPDRLVIVYSGSSFETGTRLSYPQVRQWRDTSGAFESFAGYFTWRATLTGQREAEQVLGIRTTASLFDVLGIAPVMGRLFTQADEARSAEPVTLVSEAMWRRVFGADPSIVGRRVVLNDETFTIIGVLPEWRVRPTDRPPDIVGPLRLTDQSAPADLMFMSSVARMKPGVTVAQTQEQLLSSILRAEPDAQPRPQVFLMPLRDRFVVDSKGVLMALMGAVGFLLLITCANLANLLLARAVNRRREIAVRLALGAGRGRIVTQLLTECIILSALGGLAGILVAWLGMRSVASVSAVAEAGVFNLALNWPVLAFAAGVSLVVGVLFGLIPALQTGKVSFAVDLRSGTRVATGRERLRSALVVTEVALTLVLLVGAGLLTKSLSNLISVEKGFSADSVLSFNLSVTSQKYQNPADQTRFFDSTLERISRLPGVEATGLISQLPFAGGDTYGGVDIEGLTFPPGQRPTAQKRIVSPGYFAAMGIPVKSGRVFTAADQARAPAVMVVSESFARQRFPGQNPIGKKVALLWDIEGFQTIVGVVADVKHNGLDDPANATAYVSYLQRPDSAFAVVVKTAVDPASITPLIREQIRAIDPDRPMTSVQTLQRLVSESVGARELSLDLVGGFAVIGLLLAVTGIYGVVSYATEQRSREFGIRLALGAGAPSVLRLVLRQGLGLALAGMALGLGGALALGGVIKAQLYGVEPTDPLTLAAVSAGLVAVALFACYVPARRAVRINPATVLRSE
jgi:putative ABC transport system permease protein